ncbi:MAG: oligosaccharide flippase family protein [Proteobacteria bacterium]|nr:oligosaccharide flippase family protein [Pseudomonadota bacterium]
MTSPAGLPLTSRLGHNAIAGYAGTFFSAVLNLVFVPLYVHFLGAEAYGLVGFMAALYAALTFLDVGLSATLSRQLARFRGGGYTAGEIGRLIGTFEWVFVGLAIAFALGVFAFSGYFAHDWFKAHALNLNSVRLSVCLMGLIVAARWCGSFYRSGLFGLEQIVWVNGFGIALSLFYSAMILVVLIFWPDVRLFFACQLLVSVVELFVLRARLQASLGKGVPIRGFSVQLLREHGSFSLSVALISSLWVVVMQTANLVLSKILPLAEFGYFSVAVAAAYGVTLLYSPIGQSLRPRMTFHAARGDMRSLQELVLLVSQVTFVVSAPVALTFALVPRSLLYSWTGNSAISSQMGTVLALYALGYLGAALVTPSSYLQLALGNLRLQIIGRIAVVILHVPIVILATLSYGAWGAALVWSIENFVYLGLWVPIMFRSDLPSVVVPWSKQVVTQSAALGAAYFVLLEFRPDRWSGHSRVIDGLVVLGVWIVFAAVALWLNPNVAKSALRTLRGLKLRFFPQHMRT